MRATDSLRDGSDDEERLEVGISVPSSVSVAVPNEVADQVKDGDEQALFSEVADWWDSLSTAERVDALNLSEKDGRDIVENLLFVDEVVDGGTQPIFEW